MNDLTLKDMIDYFEKILIDGRVCGTDFELDEVEKNIYERTIQALKSLMIQEDYDKMSTHFVEISGSGEILKKEFKTLLQCCKKDNVLRIALLDAMEEVPHDN